MDDEEAGTAVEKVIPDRTNPNSVAGTASITTQEVGVRLETWFLIKLPSSNNERMGRPERAGGDAL
jgi:hypothetical protein